MSDKIIRYITDEKCTKQELIEIAEYCAYSIVTENFKKE